MTQSVRATGAFDRRFLNIYLSERLVVLRAGRRLAERMLGSDVVPARRARDEFAEGERTMVSLLRQIGVRPPRVRLALADVAERLGRLKPNGRVREHSPLADLEELDGLALALRSAAGAWEALEASGVAREGLAGARAAAAAALAREVEDLRPAAARRALGA